MRLVGVMPGIVPTLSRIVIYPLKSFDPILVPQAEVLESGALRHDRQFAFIDSTGYFLNAKRTALIHRLEVQFDLESRTLIARHRTEDTRHQWQVDYQRPALEKWFSQFFSTNVALMEDQKRGFRDDDNATGPTIVTQATLQTVASWFPGLSLDQTRLRFRANLEIQDAVPFWEDHLFGATEGVVRPFRLGDVLLAGTNPCQRCVVPSRDSVTGEVWPEFAKQFSNLRETKLPDWAPVSRFNHFYRLTVNTRLIARGSGVIRVGDPVELIEAN